MIGSTGICCDLNGRGFYNRSRYGLEGPLKTVRDQTAYCLDATQTQTMLYKDTLSRPPPPMNSLPHVSIGLTATTQQLIEMESNQRSIQIVE